MNAEIALNKKYTYNSRTITIRLVAIDFAPIKIAEHTSVDCRVQNPKSFA